MEDGFTSRNFVLTLELAAVSSVLHVSAAELNPDSQEYEEWNMNESSAGIVIERAAVRHANDWYIVLRLATGDVRIERWQMARTHGAYFSDLDPAPVGIGAPRVTPALSVGIQDDRFVSPSLRPRPSVVKSTIIAGLALPSIVHLRADPDGRFLVAEVVSSAGARELLQIALMSSTTNGIVIGDQFTLIDYTTLPAPTSALVLGVVDHTRRGRAITVKDMGNPTFLWDAENDGIFENSEALSLRDSAIAYPFATWSRVY